VPDAGDIPTLLSRAKAVRFAPRHHRTGGALVVYLLGLKEHGRAFRSTLAKAGS
jgi:hypothetical protein